MTATAETPGHADGASQARLRELPYDVPEQFATGTVFKCHVGMYTDSQLARDMIWVTPHVRDTAGSSPPSVLATDLANGMGGFIGSPARGQVKVYLEDYNPAARHNPLAVADFGTVGTNLTSSGPREISLCLSYYASQNTPRYRGRLYIAHSWLRGAGGAAAAAPTVRPTAGMITDASEFYGLVLKPAESHGFKWTLASTVDKVDRLVTNWWVDDEWDVVRSRGLRGTARTTGNVPGP